MSGDIINNNNKTVKAPKPQTTVQPNAKGILLDPKNNLTEEEEEDWNDDIEDKDNKEEADKNDDANAGNNADDKKDIVVPFAYYDATLEDDESIKFALLPVPKLMPPALHAFISEVGNVENAIRALSPRTEKAKLMQELLGLAKAGGTTTYFTLACSGLEQMKSEMIVSIGNKIKYKYLIYYAKCTISVVIICLLMLFALEFFDGHKFVRMVQVDIFKNAIYMLMGTALGAWLTFAIQKREVTFQELRILNDHATSTKIKLAVIMLISLCLFMLFITGFLNLKIGEQFSTDQLKNSTGRNFAFVLGVMIGLSESKIGITLTSKIETLMAKI